MSRAQEIREAEDQAREEAWKCETCTAPKEPDDDRYCRHCRMYWEDVDAGLFSDEYMPSTRGKFHDAH